MIDTKALRQKILDMAIRGELVPQDPNDEPASVLLEKIRTEKQRLIKEGKIKKDNVDSVIFKGDDNRHYENLPNGWGEIPLVEICWLDDGNQIDGEKLVYWDAKALRGKNTKVTLSRGKVVEQGKSVILVDGENSGEVFTIPYRGYLGSTFKILQIAPLTDKNFVRIILDYNRDLFRENKTGSAIPHLNKRLFKSMNVLLPPLLEQERIAKSVDLLFTQIDTIEQNQAEIENLYDELKKRTLDLAIQGKLVPQDPSDEPASVLLEKIRAEKKAQLGKKYVDSYIYKGDDNRYYEKVGSEVKNITEEVPFDMPETWEWIRLKQVIDFSKSISISSEQITDNSWILDLEDIEKGSGKIITKKRMSEVKAKSDKHKFYRGNVLYSKLRPYLNKVIVADEDGFCTSEILAFDFSPILSEYAQAYLMSSFFVDYAMNGAYGVKMPRIGSDRGNNALMPLPPLEEQKRIVLQLHKILSKLKDEG